MEYDSYHRPPRRPPTIWQDYPLGSRLGALALGIVLMIPLAKLVHRSEGRVRTSGFAGAVLPNAVLEETTTTSAATTVPETTTTTTTATAIAPTVETIPVPTTVPAIAAAPTTARPVPTTAKAVAPTTRAAATTTRPKPVSTTARATTVAPRPTTVPARPTSTAPAPKATTAPTTAASVVSRYSAEQVIAMIREVWPADSVEKAIEVARLESGYRNWVHNGSCCYGVFQIHYQAQKRRLTARGLGLQGLYDPRVNISVALEIFLEQGWSPWSVA